MILRRLGLLLTCMFLIGSLNAQNDICFDLGQPYLTPHTQEMVAKMLIGFVNEADRSVFDFDENIWFLPKMFYVVEGDTMIRPSPCPPCQNFRADFITTGGEAFKSTTNYFSNIENRSITVKTKVVKVDTASTNYLGFGPCCMCTIMRPFIGDLIDKYSHFFGEIPEMPANPKKLDIALEYNINHDIIGPFNIDSRIIFDYRLKTLFFEMNITQLQQ